MRSFHLKTALLFVTGIAVALGVWTNWDKIPGTLRFDSSRNKGDNSVTDLFLCLLANGKLAVNRFMRSSALLFLGCSVLCASHVDAQVATARKSLRQEYRFGRIRIFYDTDGPNAVDPADADQTGLPDQVEDIAKQTWAAYTLFVETLGFSDPFKTERFGKAAFLDIHLLSKSTLGSNGVAYDELQTFRRPTDPEGTQTISFNVATSVKAPSNLTPAHEMFHLIQYGVTYFKNAWYSEGTARWSERALGLGGVGEVRYQGPWPLPKEKRDALFDMSYQAAVDFWNPLAVMDDSRGSIPEDRVSRELRDLTYSNGEKVMQDFRLNGWELMRDLLLELGKADRVAFRELGYTRWSEDNQNSKKNSPFIYQAVMDVLRRRGGHRATEQPIHLLNLRAASIRRAG